jgi:peptidyl-prolyl cis-trans isomerase A (cyclophilin A)
MKQILYILGLSMVMACNSPADSGHPQVVISTMYGDITAEVYPDKAPRSAAAFLSYVDSNFYTGASFYRILSDDNQPMGTDPAALIQGGLWASAKDHQNLPGITHESTQQTGLRHLRGTLSLARQDTGSATTEFFICIREQPGFDFGGENNPDGQGYAAFGQVIEGMDIVMKIYGEPEENQLFTPPVPIRAIKRN